MSLIKMGEPPKLDDSRLDSLLPKVSFASYCKEAAEDGRKRRPAWFKKLGV